MLLRTGRLRSRVLHASVFLVLAGGAAGWSQADSGPSSTDWAATAGNKASQRYAPLAQIDASNISSLELAWRWTSPDNALMASDEPWGSARMRPRGHSAGPVKIGDRLYVTTGFGLVAALDPSTGEQVWLHDPEAYKMGHRPTNLGFTHRGGAFWRDPDDPRDRGRVLYASADAFLRAVDAFGGEPIGSFGDNGAVDLTRGLRREIPRRAYSVSSPAVICRDVAIVGSSISDGPSGPKAPPGDVRGFDVRTGEQLWAFESVPQPGSVGHDTWENGSWEMSGNTNVWTSLSADGELGLAYLPFGTPTNDWYGGHRLGDNLFAEAIVAVDCETGERRWHFQTVHHGLWDYDLPTAAILGDIEVEGRQIRAAMQLSKQGFLYVFDRATGEPVWPIEEREVPQTGIPGERTAPTQPFPTKPPAYERQGITLADLIDFTPEVRAEAERILRRFQYGPVFTPPTERGTIQMPGYAGGSSWPGGAFDPETGMLYVPSLTWPVTSTLRKPDPSRTSFDYVGSVGSDLRGPFGLPLVKPPYSRVTAYDMNRGDIIWMKAVGEGPKWHPKLRHLDLPDLGNGARLHVLATKTLLFVSGGRSLAFRGQETDLQAALDGEEPPRRRTKGDATVLREGDWQFAQPALWAFDKASGEEIARIDLPGHSDGSPITYLQGGQQYVVLAVGGRGHPFELLAFRLPN